MRTSARLPRRWSCELLVCALWLAGLALIVPAAAASPCANAGVPGTPYQGFGAGTPGGAGKPLYHVTTLADSGSGSLRDAVSAGGRCVVFDVAGNITLKSPLYVRGSFVTIDGFTAPSPGVTLRNYGLAIWGTVGARDVIVRGVRVREAGQTSDPAGTACCDGIQIKNAAMRVVIDHVSIDHASDGALDISSQAGMTTSDVTVQWSIFSGTRNQVAMGRAARVSMHHNLFIDGQNRNPEAGWDKTLATRPADTVLDFRNNVVWNFAAYGTLVRRNATANVVNNYFYAPSRPDPDEALVVELQGRAHVSGNHSGNGANVDSRGTEVSAFAAAWVSMTDACSAADRVQEEAGARGVSIGRDAIDSRYVGQMPVTQMPGCGGGVSSSGSGSAPDLVVTSLAMPTGLKRGLSFPITFVIKNQGGTAAGASSAKLYLSTDARVSSGDVLLRVRSFGSLGAGVSHAHAITESVPTSVKPGTYYLVVAVDPDGAVKESNEGNNGRAIAVTLQ